MFLIAGKNLQDVSLIASYLQVPLRYPLRFGCSRSYIRDYAPYIEPASSDSVSDSLASTSGKPIEFPLFLEGQDSTRAAYGVFLLNKVTHIMQMTSFFPIVYIAIAEITSSIYIYIYI